MAEFKKGQRVKVEFEGEISYVFHSAPRAGVKDASGSVSNVNTEWLTDLGPADWPPQLGDIWEAEGREYYVRQHKMKPGLVVEGFSDPERDVYYDDWANFKALKPVLVRRRGQ